ncbi:titin-like [Bolinopsis microptera]|uniref:titin-like n=1 Tax=Bolinopsis microptera TaxID=2820187 RepID=UPI00307AF890
MNNFLLLFVLCLLIIRSKCGPDIFKFTSQPVSKTVNSGGTVTLSCVTTRRTGISYSWYKLGTAFNTPPENTDLISGATGTEYVVQAADVDESGEDNLFQCKATYGDDIILSDVATVKYALTDNIEYDSTGKSYIDQVVTTPDEETEAGVYMLRIQCNANETDFDTSITNGEPYDVQWFKEGESGRVEDNHDNMWTYYNPTKFDNYEFEFAGDYEVTLSTVDRYDLVIVSVRTSDKGKYLCKAVSRVNKQEVLLGSTVLTVPIEKDYPVKPLDIITGYMVLSVDDTGKLKLNPNVGDKVLLMCGAACRTSGGSYDAQYQWKDSIKNLIADTREHIVTIDSVGTATFTCEILDSECNSDVSSEDVTFTSSLAEINPMLKFTFSKSPPDYMWYDTFDNTKSHTPFEIGCKGSLSSGNTVFQNAVYKMPDQLTGLSVTEIYDFGPSITSDKSGVYQCGMSNDPNKMLWYQKTTNVVIAAFPSAGFTPTTVSVQGDTAATITCTVGGYPIKSVTISGPNSLSFDCLTSSSSGDVTCSSTDKINYVVNVNNFKLEDAGDYKCAVETKWYKSTTASASAIVNSAFDDATLSYESTTELTVSKNPADKGNSVTLTCVVKGYPEPREPVLSKTIDSLASTIAMTCSGTTTKTCIKVFSSALYTNSGVYTCKGENGVAQPYYKSSDSLTLEIVGNVDATIIQSPANSELPKGSSVTFTCKVEGSPLPTKLIFKKGTQVVKSYTGGSDSTVGKETYHLSYEYSINPLKLTDTSDYTCEGENDNGGTQTDNDTKTLTVVSDVTVSLSASTDEPSFGNAFTITCTATGGRKPHSVTLAHEGTAISTGVFPCTDDGDYSKKCTYTHTVNDYSVGGTYTCTGLNKVAGNAVRTDFKSVQIFVSKTVVVSLTPASETEITYGSAYTITCNVEGGDKPHKVTLNIPDSSTDMTWQRGSSGNSLTCTGEFNLVCKYEMSSPVYSNEGQYSCTGYNKLPGETNERSSLATGSLVVVKNVELQLTDTITSNLNEVYYGNEFKITCVAEGGRIPFYLELIQTPFDSSTPKDLVLYDTTASKTPDSVTVDDGGNTLTYVSSVTNSGYDDIGTYKCLSKNKAALMAEQDAEDEVDVIVVRNVKIDQIDNIKVDFGTSLVYNFQLNGGRSPHLVKLDIETINIFHWEGDSNVCTGTNTLTCTKTIGAKDVNWAYDGTFTVTAENRAMNNGVMTDTMEFSVTVYKDVVATITPSSEETITYHEDKIITCKVEGGLSPHQVDLILPNLGTKTWKKDGSVESLTCSGEHVLTCTHNFTPEYDSDGDYMCKGYNEGRSGQIENESGVKLTTVRQTQVNVSKETISVLTNGVIEIDCIIVGKPLVDKSSVTWTHSKDFDFNEYVKTVDGTEDNFTLISKLTLTKLVAEYNGTFNCNVADHDGENISKAVNVFINNREFLEPPKVNYNDAEFIETGSQIFITCFVQGFPAPSASLTSEGQDSMLETTERPTITSTKFVFSVTTTCDYLKLNFSCNVKTTTSSEVLKESTQIVGPSITGCENPLPVILGGGIGGGVVFIVLIAVVVFFILRRIKVNKDKSYTPKNGAEFPNPTFVADPTYATVGDNNQVGATGGYSHLNRPAGETDEEGYACIGQLKPGTANIHPTGEDAYATLDTTSNGMLGLRRQGSNETYAALNRPAPGKAKRGVISKYKPMSNKPKTFGMPPNKPATDDIEMGETSHGGQPDPTYATVNPQTLKSKMKPSNYADVTLPDLPPEVPIYGNSSLIQRPIPSEYADVTVAPPQTPYNMADRQRPILSEYADVTLPGPPEVLYSNMANRQDNTPEEDPVYAQVDLKNRTLPQRRVEEEEDLPPDVPVYGTIGQLTEPDIPDFEDEDPYATVEFVPKSKRKPPRPKPKENASEGVYATITDIKENL